MEHLLLIIIGILLLIIFVLVAKVYFLRKSAQEIAEAFRDRLTVDTNTPKRRVGGSNPLVDGGHRND